MAPREQNERDRHDGTPAGGPGAVPRILFVHGRSAKPARDAYRAQLWRCLIEGVRRADARAAGMLAREPDCFRLVYWSDIFYDTERDLAVDAPGIERVLRLTEPTAGDIHDAHKLRHRAEILLYRIIDRFPHLMRRFADSWLDETIRDTQRYLDDTHGLADRVHDRVREALEEAAQDGRPLILIGHSLGSVVAYDTLWKMSHVDRAPAPVTLFLTLGSPLGTRFIQSGLAGWKRSGAERFPRGIAHWHNLAAEGDAAALDPEVEHDFGAMHSLGLVETLTDNTRALYNTFRDQAGPNQHRSYGYLVMPATGRAIVRVMRTPSPAARSSG